MDELSFPISDDESTLDNDQQAVITFQDYFRLVKDGVVGAVTRETVQKEMFVIQHELDWVMKPEPRLRLQNAPFYGS